MAGSQEISAHFQVPFVAFPFGGVTVQILRHALGDGLGKGDQRSSHSTKLHDTEKNGRRSKIRWNLKMTGPGRITA